MVQKKDRSGRRLFGPIAGDFPDTIKQLTAQMDRAEQATATARQAGENEAAMHELFTPQPNGIAAPVMLTPVQQRWCYFGLGSGALFFGFYGTGMLPG